MTLLLVSCVGAGGTPRPGDPAGHLRGTWHLLTWKHRFMTIRALPGVPASQVIELIVGAQTGLINVRGHAHTALDLYNAYLEWANGQVRMLRHALTPATRDQLVTTRRHWALVALDPTTMGNALAPFVESEIDDQLRVIDTELAGLRRAVDRYSMVDALIVPDTNVFAGGLEPWEQVPWATFARAGEERVRLVLPMLVIDELDRLKDRGPTEKGKIDGLTVRNRARRSLRAMERLFQDPAEPVTLSTGEVTVSASLVFDDPAHDRLPDADDEIVDRVRSIADFAGTPATVVSSDLGMRLRARMAGLRSAEPWSGTPTLDES